MTTIFIFVMTMIVSEDPRPVFMFIRNFETSEQCEEAIKKLEVDQKTKERIGCMAIGKESI